MVKIGKTQKQLATFLMILSSFGFLGSINYIIFTSSVNGLSVLTFFALIIIVLSGCIFATCYYIHQGLVFFLQILQSVLIMVSVVAFAIALIIPAIWQGYIIGAIASVSLALSYAKN